MQKGKILGVALSLLGAAAFIFGSYIASEAAQGEDRLHQAEENVQEGHRPILGPVRRNARNSSAMSAQERINEAGQNVARSEVTANWLRGTGVALFVVGLICLIFTFPRRKRNS